MLSNRVGRLITTALLLIGVIAINFTVGGWIFGEEIAMAGTMGIFFAFAVALANQFMWDFLNFGFMDGIVGTVLRNIVFFATALFAAFAGVTIGGEYVAALSGDAWFLSYGWMAGGSVSGLVTAAIYMLMSSTTDDREYCPFFPVYGALAPIAVCAVAHLLLGSVEFVVLNLPTILTVLVAVVMVLYIIFRAFPYTDKLMLSGGGKQKSSSGGYSSGGYSSGGYSSGGRSSSSSSSSYGRENNPGAMESYMRQIASRHSGSWSLSYGTLKLNTRVAVYTNEIVFTFSGEVQIGYNCTGEYEANCLQEEAESKIADISQDILNEANNEIDTVRELYSNFDRDYNIRTKMDRIPFTR